MENSLQYSLWKDYRILESLVKLHRIIIKVRKIVCFTCTKISTPAIFFNQHQTFVAPHDPHDRRSRSQMFFKINILRNFVNFIAKHPVCRSLIFKKLQAWRTATLLKGDSNTGVFLWNLRNFYEQLFLQNTSSGCFWRAPYHSRYLAYS